ncbi:MAG: DUF2183 domain-containing protein [Bdellovibrionales bacterium]|nr:DUF2183 domain-containing protein [Bdellovibrionales bacterium]
MKQRGRSLFCVTVRLRTVTQKRLRPLFVLALSVAAPNVWGAEPFVVVSDIDDTVKLTNVMNKAEAVKNGFFGKKTFLGMAELYQAWLRASGLANTPDERFMYFLSASPTFLRSGLWNTLITLGGFPDARLVLRHWVAQPSTHDYKIGSLRNIANRSAHELVLVGDDTEHDPEIFLEFAGMQPGRVGEVWVRRNLNRPLPPGARGFYSAFDLALAELESGRIEPQDVLAVAERILSAGRPDLLFPDFSYCPMTELIDLPAGPVELANPAVSEARRAVVDYVIGVCVGRE